MITVQPKNNWPLAGSLVLILLVFALVLYQHTALYLISLWSQLEIGEYAHGYLVLAISIYLIFSHRQELSALSPRPEYRALFIVVGASMLWMVSALVDVEMLQALALLLLIFALVWSTLGNQAIRLLAFPILFIVFAIPVWFPLSPVLQNITADVVFSAIRLLSIPAFRQDNLIMLPAGTLSIEEACSGLRYLLAALTLGTLYAYMNYSSIRARLLVVLIAASLAVLANMLRVFIVVYLGYTTDMQHPLVNDHLTLGWYLFAGLTAILFFADIWLHKRRAPALSTAPPDPSMPNINSHMYSHRRYFLFVATAGVMIATAPAVVHLASVQMAAAAATSAPQLPQQAGGWRPVLVSNDDWSPLYHGAVSQQQSYQKGDHKIAFYMGYYPAQKQGAELINDLNRIGTKDKWRAVYPLPRLHDMDGRPVLEQVLENGAKQQRLLWYWYNVAGTVTTNKYEAKVLQVLGLLAGRPWGFVAAVAVDYNDDIDIARQLIKDFMLSTEKPMEKEIERVTASH